MSNDNVIQVMNVQKRFGNKVAVQDVSFAIKKGEIFGLLGPNGAGKTTILRMITTLLRQDAGKILL
ncbi:ATP-binding cassette domain-containing protein, partial [Liquorilactobacillus sicerae]|uniref:ATP-binding cassette domain-containing protein n=1 Tax=Liquorilactobacillus sicerae TaxID=1416943 RepID=UPI0024815D34